MVLLFVELVFFIWSNYDQITEFSKDSEVDVKSKMFFYSLHGIYGICYTDIVTTTIPLQRVNWKSAPFFSKYLWNILLRIDSGKWVVKDWSMLCDRTLLWCWMYLQDACSTFSSFFRHSEAFALEYLKKSWKLLASSEHYEHCHL